MSCHCHEPRRWRQADQAALCWGCADRLGSTCRASGEGVRYHTLTITCGGGRVSPRGRVHWWGASWVGLPWPLRFVLWLAGVRGVPWVGCGCLVPLRASWARWRRSLSRG